MIALATSGMAVTGVFGDPWKSGAKEVDSPDRVGIFDPQLKVETEALEETPRPVRKLRPMREWVECEIRCGARRQGVRAAGIPHPWVFFAKSSELLENKRLEFLAGAKKCKRVWKSMKIKGMNGKQTECLNVEPSGRIPPPHLFVSADSTGVTGEFFVSADSKGVISPLFPADPRGACKCGL